MKKIEFERDGLKIRGHVFGAEEGPRPAVILSHAFLANERMCHGYAELLAEMGYLAVTFDFCGGGVVCSSDGRPQDMTLFTEKADLLAVIRGVKQRFSPLYVSLLGCSQGGLVSGLTAADPEAEEIRRLALFYPALSIPDDARRGRMMTYRFDPDNIPELLGSFPMKLGGDYARTVMDLDPFEALKAFTGPVLLLHGTADTIVDIAYSRRLKELYPNCRYEEIEGGGHMFQGKADLQARALLREFMSPELK